jgi:hypothetical protein
MMTVYHILLDLKSLLSVVNIRTFPIISYSRIKKAE